MNKGQLTHAFLSYLQYNRRFQECVYLLKIRSNLYKKEPLKEFWEKREQHYLAWDHIPQTRSFLEYDIERVCAICGIENNRSNALLIFTCAHYGVWRTTRWLQKQINENGDQGEEDIALTTAFMVIRYLASLLTDNGGISRVDNVTYSYIEKVTSWLEENGWGNFQMEKPHKSTEEWERLKFHRDIADTLPLQVRILVNQITNQYPNDLKMRKREDRRSYIFWRWRRSGMKMQEIAERWDQFENKDYPTQEKVVRMALGKYLKECGPISTDPPTQEYFKVLSQYEDTRTFADKVLEQVYREVESKADLVWPPNEEIKIK